MIIIHGDDYVASRNYLNELIDLAKTKNQTVTRLDADKLELAQVVQVVESVGFFELDYLLIIFGFFSEPKSKRRDNFLNYLKEHQISNVVLYESKTVNANSLKALDRSQISHHKPSTILFGFLENIKPGNGAKTLVQYQQLLDKKTPPELIFALLIRQVRLLIQAGEPESLKTAPWMKNKLISQARAFGIDKLLRTYNQLYQIDKNIKTGRNPLALSLQLYNLIIQI